jgi:hypothetical protein
MVTPTVSSIRSPLLSSLSLSLSLSLSFLTSLSVSLSLSLCLCLCLCLSVCLSVSHLSLSLCLCLSLISCLTICSQNICLQMCRQSNSILPRTSVSSHRLLWQANDPNRELHELLFPSPCQSSPLLFDRIIASDCMFFKDFHTDLLWILDTALSADGVVYMLQPRRGDTMERFLSLAQQYFHISIQDNYSAKVSDTFVNRLWCVSWS